MKEIKIQIPEGYEGIDEEKSNFTEGRIVFKKKQDVAWKNGHNRMSGYFISSDAEVTEIPQTYTSFSDNPEDNNVFATKQQAKSVLAMAQLSQIIANDERFGEPVTDEEWDDSGIEKYCITRIQNDIRIGLYSTVYKFLAFHTEEQRDLFLKENKDLIKQYYMLD